MLRSLPSASWQPLATLPVASPTHPPEVDDGDGLAGGGGGRGEGAVRVVQGLDRLGQVHWAAVEEEELAVACRGRGERNGGGGLRKTHRRSPGCSPGGGVEGGGATERTWGLEGAVQAAKPQCPPSPKPSTALPPPGHPHATHSRTPPPVPTRRLPPEDRPLAAAALDTQPAMVMGTPPSSTSTCSGSTPSAALLPNTVRMLSLRTITRGKTSVRSGKMAAAGRRGVPRWLALCPARRSPPPPPPSPPRLRRPLPRPTPLLLPART